jgi:hypothetical protein
MASRALEVSPLASAAMITSCSRTFSALLDTAYAAWADLAQDAGRRLLDPVGGLYARPLDDPHGLSGPGCEEVDAARAAEIFPGLRR